MAEDQLERNEAEAQHARCGECGAAVEVAQRYCVICGAHRAKAPDPVARYLSEASAALARVRTAETARAAAAGRRRPLPRISALLATALAVAAAAIGFGIGSSSGGTTVVVRHTAAKTTHTSTCSNKSYENNCGGVVAEP